MNIKRLRLLLIATLAMSACRGREREYPGPYGDKVANAVPAIERVTGLKFKEPPAVETRSRAQVREFVLSQFKDPQTLNQLTGMEAAYKQLGLVPVTMNLQKFLTDLLEEQIVGYYDPKTKVLYIVQGSDREAVGITVTHELIHALQDQYINLDSIQHNTDNNDRSSAGQAVFEGQAVFDQLVVMMGAKGAALNLPGGWERVREMIRENRSSMPVFASAPTIIQETLIFPYLSGAEFIRNFKDKRPNDTLYKDMPVSTEQILHTSAYFTERDAPTSISFTGLRNAKVVYENTLGEFETRVFLYEHLKNQEDAVRGATGWDGDRYMLVDTPAGRGIVWATVWDSAVDAGEFRTMMLDVIKSRDRNSSATVTGGEVNGRPVVLYVDVPKGAGRGIMGVSGIKLDNQTGSF